MPEAKQYEMSLPVIVYPAKTLHGNAKGYHAMFPGNRFKISGFGSSQFEAVESLNARLVLVINKGFTI